MPAQQSKATSSALPLIMDNELKTLMPYYRGVRGKIKEDMVSCGKEAVVKIIEDKLHFFDREGNFI